MAQANEIETLKNKLHAERRRLLDVCARVQDANAAALRADEWSAQEVLAHVANAEMLNVKFARLMLEQTHPNQIESVVIDFPDYVGAFELDRFNAYMREKLSALSFDHVMENLTRAREETLAWLETLTVEQLERAGEHAAWGQTTVRGILKILLLHDKMHANDLLKRIRALE